MSNYAWVCFNCRLAVRRPGLAQAPRCASCREACICLGYKIPVPPKSKIRQWKALRDSVFLYRRENLLREDRTRVELTHRLEREITRYEVLQRNSGRAAAIKRLRQQLTRLDSVASASRPAATPMFFSPILIRHGILALREEIARLQRIEQEVGDDWPAGFDPNDIAMHKLVLQGFLRHESAGYQEQHWKSKPIVFFFDLIRSYMEAQGEKLPPAERAQLLWIAEEFRSRIGSARG